MRKTTIVSLRGSKLRKTFSQNNLLIGLTISYLIGILLGVFFVGGNLSVEALAAENFSQFFALRKSSGFAKIFLSSAADSLPVILILFLSGTSFIGIALSPMAVCYQGFKYGILSGYLYLRMSLQGIAFNALILIPSSVISVFGVLLCGKAAFEFSVNLAKISMPKGQSANLYNHFKEYCKRYIFLILIFIAAFLLDATLCVSFLKFFGF